MKIISQSEFEVTARFKNGKVFTVYSSTGNPLDLLLSIVYRDTVKVIRPGVKLTQVFKRSLEDTNPFGVIA